MSKKTLVSLLIRAIEDYDINDEILFTKQGEKYIPLTRGELISKVLILKEYLDSINLKKGDKVAIISENRPEWILTDLCCLISGFITVPVYTSLSPESVKYILKDSGTAVCFVSTALQLEKVISVRNELPDLKFIVFFNGLERIYNDDKLIPLNSILGNMKIQPLGLLKEIINKAGENINEEDLVTIIYTSGTTGTPKGCYAYSQKHIL